MIFQHKRAKEAIQLKEKIAKNNQSDSENAINEAIYQ